MPVMDPSMVQDSPDPSPDTAGEALPKVCTCHPDGDETAYEFDPACPIDGCVEPLF